MLRNHPSQRFATILDTELGIAALLLLLTVVLAVVLVPENPGEGTSLEHEATAVSAGATPAP